jgi:RNA polymerase sigma-70 factor (ECF subfamily)
MTNESRQADLEDLFARSADRVLLFIRMRLGTKLAARMEPMDVLQDTWVEAQRGFDGFASRGRGSFTAWLCRIAENRIRALADHHGAAKRTPPGEPLPVSRVLERARADATGPVTAAARSEDRERLERALGGLEADEREALLMRHFLGRTFEEVAEALDLPPTTARRLVGRATARLGRILREGGA